MKIYTYLGVFICVLFNHAFACIKDTDCKGDRICVISSQETHGQCQSPHPVHKSSSIGEVDHSSHVSTQNVSQNESLRNFHINLLGALQFGLTPTLEWGKQLTTLVRARLLNTGVLSYIIADADGGSLLFGLGLSAQIRKYFGTDVQSGPYLGGGIEVMYTQNEGDRTWETVFAVPQFEGGFRWQSKGYFTGFGIFAGLAIPVVTVNHEDYESLITGGLIWDIGWRF